MILTLESTPVPVMPLQLREQANYRLEVSWCGDIIPDIKCFPNLSSVVLRQDPGSRRDQIWAGNLNFRDYVGETTLEIHSAQGELFRANLEVRSQKLGYLDDYVQLLDALAQRTSALLWRLGSPVYASCEVVNNQRVTLGDEQFLLLRHLVLSPELDNAWRNLSRAMPRHLVCSQQWCSMGRHVPRSGEELATGYRHANRWTTAPPSWELPAETQRQIPLRYARRFLELRCDTPENRFVRSLYEVLRDLLQNLRNRYHKLQNRTWVNELDRLLHIWEAAWRNVPFLHELQPIRGETIPRPTLAQNALYRPFLKAWEFVSGSLRLSWSELAEAVCGPMRDMAKLYEYWCFFEIWSALEQVATRVMDGQNWWMIDEYGLRAEIRRDVGFPFCYRDYELYLFYQRRFVPGPHTLQSYSVSLVPDYSIEIRSPSGEQMVLCFDAKYRPDRDLEKMHAYRDALRGAIGCYVFYPGEQQTPAIFTLDERQLLPGVGAFSLRPNPDSRSWLEQFLRWVLDQITQ
jgi:hypothetical protein